MPHTLEIVSYTDPYCTWCWGSEPILRHLQEVYGDQLTVRFVMGGLVEDQSRFHDPANGIGGDGWADQIAAHWIEASPRHGMPVDVTEFRRAAPPSTWPSNIAYKAAEIQDPSLAGRYLRHLREAVATESQPLHKVDVLADLAEDVGLDRHRFLLDFDGPAREAFAMDRLECGRIGAQGFPTFLVTVDGHERLVRGYRTFDQMTGVIDALAGSPIERRIARFDDRSVLDFVERYASATTREVSEVFDVSMVDAQKVLDLLLEDGSLAVVGNGLVYRPAVGAACDPKSGVCL